MPRRRPPRPTATVDPAAQRTKNNVVTEPPSRRGPKSVAPVVIQAKPGASTTLVSKTATPPATYPGGAAEDRRHAGKGQPQHAAAADRAAERAAGLAAAAPAAAASGRRADGADGAPAPQAPGPARRLACFVYEGVLLFGVLMIAGLAYGLLTQQRHALVGMHGLQLFVFLVLGLYFSWFWSHGGQTVAMKTWQIRLLTKRRPARAAGTRRAALSVELAVVHSGAGLCLLRRAEDRRVDRRSLGIGGCCMRRSARLNARRQYPHDLICGTRLVLWRTPKRSPR